jgi:two-component system response regulator AtoC
MGTVLIVDDEPRVREGLTSAMESRGHLAKAVGGVSEARALLAAEPFDCVLLDVRLGDGDGLDLLREIQAGPARSTPVVMATALGDSERAIGAIKAGAFDYLTKPFDLQKLLDTVERAIRSRTNRGLASATPDGEQAEGTNERTLVGASAPMLEVWKAIGRAAPSDVPVLLVGETGTGKELVARALHEHSPRARQPFVAVNLAALAPTLLESELFGHEKGAFTGASRRRAGRFELAGQGTLFLDEIGDLDAGLQTKLLRVLNDGTFERVGGTEVVVNRARIVAATHRPVRPSEKGAALREDLYYRLAVVEIAIPPLRARKSDIPMLVAHALRGTRARAVTEEAMEKLRAYDWPGNVRELVHVIARAAVMRGSEVIDVTDLPPQLVEAPRGRADEESLVLKDAIGALEHRLIEAALERAHGNRTEAARLLGIDRPQLYRKIAEHGIRMKGQSRDDD